MPLPSLSLTVLSLLASTVSLTSTPAYAALPDIWTNAPQNIHYAKDVSFRGLSDGRVAGFDVSGHA